MEVNISLQQMWLHKNAKWNVKILGCITFGLSWFSDTVYELRKLRKTTDSQGTSFDSTNYFV